MEATCTTNGLTIKYCKQCGTIESQTEIPATGHSLVTSEAKKATCTEDGVTEAKYCSTCGWGKHAETIAALGHIMQSFNKVDATCETTGHEAGEACIREGCGYRTGGATIQPKGHDFDTDGMCKHEGCTTQKTVYEGKAVFVNQDNVLSGNIDFGDKDKRKDLITLVLTGDIEISADRFCELFGSDKVAKWIENGEVTEETDITEECNGNGIYALDIILNGYSLTINCATEDSRSDFAVEVYGYFAVNGKSRTTGRETTGESKLVLNGKSIWWGSPICAVGENAFVTIDMVNVFAETDVISAAHLGTSNDKPNSAGIVINNSTLTSTAAPTTTKNQDILLYFDLTPVGEATYQVDKNNVNNSYLSPYESITSDGVIKLYATDGTQKDFSISFYILDENGNKVYLKLDNYFDDAYWYSPNIKLQSVYIWSCAIDICEIDSYDEEGNLLKAGDLIKVVPTSGNWLNDEECWNWEENWEDYYTES